jgi:RNA polymerase sigma factor (sigma-70 family)
MAIRYGFAAARIRPDIPADAGAIELEFAEAFAAEERRLLAIALSILRSQSEAEDAVQATAVRAWKAWHQRADGGNTGRWMTSICVRQCITRRRLLLRGRAMTAELTDQLPDAARTAGADRADPDLDQAYATLSKRQRAVISLHYGQGYALNECAEIMQCRAGTVASHLSRALTKLRKALSDD